jgi:glycosyltransferase involved in cell wall biosynthesis
MPLYITPPHIYTHIYIYTFLSLGIYSSQRNDPFLRIIYMCVCMCIPDIYDNHMIFVYIYIYMSFIYITYIIYIYITTCIYTHTHIYILWKNHYTLSHFLDNRYIHTYIFFISAAIHCANWFYHKIYMYIYLKWLFIYDIYDIFHLSIYISQLRIRPDSQPYILYTKWTFKMYE